METIDIKIKDLKPYPKNAKKHPPEQVKVVAQSIKEFGWAQPIVIDENNEILIGHGRLKAAKLLNLETAPCLVLKGLTEEQKKKLRLIDNKSNESDWDLDLLKEELLDLDFSDFPDIDWGVLLEDKDIEVEENDFDGEPTDIGVQKHLYKCPVCGHINEEKAFKNYEDTD